MNIVTHNGVFHTDEVAAIAALLTIYDFKVLRTRDTKLIADAAIVVDVGGIYDPESECFDHHQKGGAGTRPNGVPYASFGLVWLKYGSQICQEVLGNTYKIDYSQVAKLVEESLVMGIDARDNGVKTHMGLNNASPYTISDAISALNPNWYAAQSFDGPFFQAVEIFKIVLINEIRNQAGKVLAETQVLEMLEGQSESKILVFDKFVPWGNIVPLKAPQALYVIFPDVSGTWRVQAVPVGVGKEAFDLKAPFPENWRGKPQAELAILTNCQDAIFCHNGGFIMGTKTFDAAMHCAELAVQLHELPRSLR